MSDNGMNFNTVPPPNYAAPLVNFGQATKQPASTGTQPQGQVNPTAAQTLGSAIGKWITDYRSKMQQMGGAQGQQQQAPVTWNVTPQQQPGAPMNIVPQGYGYQ
jgi:hypothetical protein